MATRLESVVLDGALAILIANVAKVTLCTAEPTNATEANTTYAIANAIPGSGWSGTLFGAAADSSPNGREILSQGINSAAVTADGTARWMAFLNAAGTVLYGVIDIPDQVLLAGNTWAHGSITIRLPAS